MDLQIIFRNYPMVWYGMAWHGMAWLYLPFDDVIALPVIHPHQLSELPSLGCMRVYAYVVC